MKGKKRISLMLCMALVMAITHTGWAAEDKADGRGERNKRESGGAKKVSVVNNKTYLKECGSCHFAYQPELLPRASWQKIMEGLDKHFKEDASLDDGVKAGILEYLVKNSAETGKSRLSAKLLASIGKAEAPLRISDTAYFKKEHRRIKPEMLKRKSILTIANCSACHTTADDGEFGEDFIKVPRQ
jgi:cytochrome c553